MKAKKDHDSDEERENEEVAPPTVTEDAVKNTPISPPSQNSDANRRSERQMEVIRYSYLEDPEEGVLFEEHSVELKCPFCNTNAYSIVEYKSNILGYLVSLILLFALGWLSFCILPLVLSLTKSAVHRCSKCLNEVKNNSLLGFNSMEDKVISFNIGSFGVILSRKYLLYIVLSLTCLIVLIMLLTSGVNMNETRPITNYTWVEYKNDCGYQAFIKNPREAIPNFYSLCRNPYENYGIFCHFGVTSKAFTVKEFDHKYAGKGISWDGYIVQVNSINEDNLSHFHHATMIFIKMVPDDKLDDDPSVVLTFSDHMTEQFKEEMIQLNIGDHVKFNSTIVGLGDRNHLHHLHTFGLQKISGSAYVNIHVHNNTRYENYKLKQSDEKVDEKEDDTFH